MGHVRASLALSVSGWKRIAGLAVFVGFVRLNKAFNRVCTGTCDKEKHQNS